MVGNLLDVRLACNAYDETDLKLWTLSALRASFHWGFIRYLSLSRGCLSYYYSSTVLQLYHITTYYYKT